MCAKSQSQLLQELNNLQNDGREALKRAAYFKSLAGLSIAEQYRCGHISLVLDLGVHRNSDEPMSALGIDKGKCGTINSAFLILHNDSINRSYLKYWNDELVLIGNIKLVSIPNILIPSLVWFYLGNDPFMEVGSEGVYLSPMKRRCKFLRSIPHGEFGKFRRLDFESDKGTYPCEVKTGVKIMNSIADDEGYFTLNDFRLRKSVLEKFTASLRIELNTSYVACWQLVDESIYIRDVLLGPF